MKHTHVRQLIQGITAQASKPEPEELFILIIEDHF
jgi:hypothetical protein